jgi:hypothetical protein
LRDPLGLVGKLTVDGALAERARLQAYGCEVELRLALRQLEVTQAADRTRRLSVDCAEIDELMAATPYGHLLIGQVVLEGLTGTLAADGSLELRCERVRLDSLELRARDLDAHIERVTLTDLRHAAGHTTVEALTVGAVTLEARAVPVASLLPPSWAAPRPPGPFVPPRLPDIPFLDDLCGRVNVDAFLDVGIPILKSRAATHTVRQELVDGTSTSRSSRRASRGSRTPCSTSRSSRASSSSRRTSRSSPGTTPRWCGGRSTRRSRSSRDRGSACACVACSTTP